MARGKKSLVFLFAVAAVVAVRVCQTLVGHGWNARLTGGGRNGAAAQRVCCGEHDGDEVVFAVVRSCDRRSREFRIFVLFFSSSSAAIDVCFVRSDSWGCFGALGQFLFVFACRLLLGSGSGFVLVAFFRRRQPAQIACFWFILDCFVASGNRMHTNVP